MQVGERSLDNPALGAQAGAVLGAAAGDLRLDDEVPERAAVLVVVVAPVGQHHIRAAPGPAALAPHRWYGLEQGDQLSDVVAIAAGQSSGEWDAGRVDDQVVFAARPAPVDRASSRLGAPFNARMWEQSTAAREKSRAFAPRSSARRTSCSRGHTPASVHSARRRQQVMPEPKPSSCGRCSQAIPVCSTNRIPWNTSRSGCRLHPGCRTRRSTLGNNGSITAHSSSSTSQVRTVVPFFPVRECASAAFAAVRDDQPGAAVAAVRYHRGVADGVLRHGQFPRLAVVAIAGHRATGGDDEPGVRVDDDLVVGGVPVVLRLPGDGVVAGGVRVSSTSSPVSLRNRLRGRNASDGPRASMVRSAADFDTPNGGASRRRVRFVRQYAATSSTRSSSGVLQGRPLRTGSAPRRSPTSLKAEPPPHFCNGT